MWLVAWKLAKTKMWHLTIFKNKSIQISFCAATYGRNRRFKNLMAGSFLLLLSGESGAQKKTKFENLELFKIIKPFYIPKRLHRPQTTHQAWNPQP